MYWHLSIASIHKGEQILKVVNEGTGKDYLMRISENQILIMR